MEKILTRCFSSGRSASKDGWTALWKRWTSLTIKGNDRLRSNYKYFQNYSTRWKDNDQYGHVNNVVYYEWIDSIVNEYLIDRCGMNPLTSPIVVVVVSSSCSFYSPLRYPQRVHLDLNVQRIGTSSVDYRVAIFPSEPSNGEASAVVGFTHVFVDRQANKSRAIPPAIRSHLEKLLCPKSDD